MDNEVNVTPETGERTFTQEDVNRIVGERLAKEKGKSDAELAEREQGIQQRELLLTARERLAEAELPAALLDALNMSTKEALDNSLAVIKQEFEKIKPKTVHYREGNGFVTGIRDSCYDAQEVRSTMGLKT